MDRATWRTLVVLVVISALGAAAVTAFMATRPRSPQATLVPLAGGTTDPASLEVLFEAPAFTLTDQAGEPFGHTDLRGKVWVVDFIFTRCQGPCPMMTASMKQVQDALAGQPGWEDVRLVSVTVDPAHDTPEVLRDYAQRHGADPEHWKFLTGERQTLWPLIEEGFKLPVAEAPDNAMMPITHSTKFLLVDRAGQVRGVYNGLSAEERRRLVADVQTLLAEPDGPVNANG